MLKLFMDCRYTRTRVHDGISRFTAELTAAAAAHADVTMIISDPAQLRLLPDLPYVTTTSPTSPREPWVARQINQYAPDVVFSPMQTMGSWGRAYPLLLTLHDLIYYQHRTPPRDLPSPVRFGWRVFHLSYQPQRWFLNRADAVATVSHTTRSLMQEHRLTRRPIEVIGNAPARGADPRDPLRTPSKDLVYMGSFMDYKNVEAVVRSVNRLPDFTLHLCSPISAQRRAELAAEASDVRQLVFHDGIEEADYNALLHRATALISLSRAEGYGLPLVEAMSHGTPVIVSDLPIFAEIAGEAVQEGGAQIVSPDDPEATAQAVRALSAPEKFGTASRAAHRRSQDYSWDASAQRLIEMARRAAAQYRRD